MGVLEGTYIYNKEELINELIYQEICRYFGININEISIVGIDDKGYIVKYKKHNDKDILNLEEFLVSRLSDEKEDDLSLDESKKEEKESLRRTRFNSLESIETGFRYLYPRVINYNSDRRMLRTLSGVITIDYLLGNTSRDIANVTIYNDSDKNYSIEEIGKSDKLFGKNPGITPFTCPSKTDTFKRTLEKALDKFGWNFSISLFIDNLIKYNNEIDNSKFADIVTAVMLKNYINLSDKNLGTLMDNYNRQRVLIQETYNFRR